MPIFTPSATGAEIAASNAQNITGKVILTTGVTPNGLGAFFNLTAAAQAPKLLVLANRNLKAAEETATAIAKAHPGVSTRLLHLDLNSLASVKKAAAEVTSWNDVPSIDVLVNNAGIMAPPYGKTEDGFEAQFGVNHLAHFLFTNLIIDKLLAQGGARVVIVSSEGYRHSAVRFGDYDFDVCPSGSYLTVPPSNNSRTARRMMHGAHMANQNLPTTSTQYLWPKNWAQRAS